MREAPIYWVNLPPPPSHSAEDRATRADSGDRPGEHAGLHTALHHRTVLRTGRPGPTRGTGRESTLACTPPSTIAQR